MKTEAQKLATRLWKLRNAEKVKQYMVKYRAENKERLSAQNKIRKQQSKEKASQSYKAWRISKREELLKKKREYAKKRYSLGIRWTPKTNEQKETIKKNSRNYWHKRKLNPQHKIAIYLRNRIKSALKGFQKTDSCADLTGCSWVELKNHIESQFDSKMSWQNHGSYWHIDHIKECCRFDLTKPEEQSKCFHYSNLRPLEKTENIRRSCQLRRVL